MGHEPVFEKSIDSGPPERMQCMEVFGGSHSIAHSIEFDGLDCWIYSKPYGNATSGGDVFYASSCATGRITRLLLADISEHGESVANLAKGLRTLMRRFVNRLDQGEFVRLLNDDFARFSPGGIFATAIVGTFFGPSRRLQLCNAGHPRPLLYRAATGRWALLGSDPMATERNSSNLPLGIFENVHYEQFDIELEPGDCVLAYTDALSESCDAAGEMLCDAGLLQIVEGLGAEFEPADLIGALKDEILRHDNANLCDDDVTMMLVRANGCQRRYSLGEQMRAVGRFLVTLVKSVKPGSERPPFPDLQLANVGGALIPALGRRWRAPRASHRE